MLRSKVVQTNGKKSLYTNKNLIASGVSHALVLSTHMKLPTKKARFSANFITFFGKYGYPISTGSVHD